MLFRSREPPPAPAPPPPPPPGAVTFDIKPEGEVWIDGALKGKSPPLKRIQLSAGYHVLEIRLENHKSLLTELDVGAGEELAVQHNFVAPPPPKPAPAPAKKKKPAPPPAPKEKSFWDKFLEIFQ